MTYSRFAKCNREYRDLSLRARIRNEKFQIIYLTSLFYRFVKRYVHFDAESRFLLVPTTFILL